MITGQHIRTARIMKDISPKEMADRLDMDYSTYSRLERGQTKLTEERFSQILSILGLSRSYVETLSGNKSEATHDLTGQLTHLISKMHDLMENQNKMMAGLMRLIEDIKDKM